MEPLRKAWKQIVGLVTTIIILLGIFFGILIIFPPPKTPSVPTVTNCAVSSPYVSTTSDFSATCSEVGGTLSNVTFSHNQTGTMANTTIPTGAVATYNANFSLTLNSTILIVKWRVFVNDTSGTEATSEWQYTRTTPPYTWSTVVLACNGNNSDTGNMTETGTFPVLSSDNCPTGYLSSGLSNSVSKNYTFAPFVSANTSYSMAIDVMINWTTMTAIVLKITLHVGGIDYSVNASVLTADSWVICTMPIQYGFQDSATVRNATVSFTSYTGYPIKIDSCSLVVKYSAASELNTYMTMNTNANPVNRPLNVFTSIVHAMIFPYLDVTDGCYWIAAFDLYTLAWVDSMNTTIPAYDGNGDRTCDAGHFAPSIGMLPNGSLMFVYCHETYFKWFVSTYSAKLESNVSKLISYWGSVNQFEGDTRYSYPLSVSFSDRILIFVQSGIVTNGNLTLFTVTNQSITRLVDFIYNSDGTGLYAFPTSLQESGKLYCGWYRYNRTDAFVIVTQDKGETWTLINGTVITFPFEAAPARVVEVDYELVSIIDDEDSTDLYFAERSSSTSWWAEPSDTYKHAAFTNASTLAPNAAITLSAIRYCVDEFGNNIAGIGVPIYDSSINKTFLHTYRSAFQSLDFGYTARYQKLADNRFFLLSANTSYLNFGAIGYGIFPPSVPYSIFGSTFRRGICGSEVEGTAFNKTEYLELYPFTAAVSENTTYLAIRVKIPNWVVYGYETKMDYFIYDENMTLIQKARYGDPDVHGTKPRDTWDYVPLTSTVPVTAGKTYWIGVLIPWDGVFYNGGIKYFRTDSTTTGRSYTELSNWDAVPTNLTTYNYTSTGSYSISMFLVSQKITFFGSWDSIPTE